ncbi:MAG TPA: hypothetical protein VG099_21060 [Gemmataceae bacterium]|jgi:hypothetical protein|nr:hypothetical protein [Gemmataceae bacterium]
MLIRVTDRELDTLLAALRTWQRTVAEKQAQELVSPSHFEDGISPLTAEEIDELCERLNFSDEE